MNDTLHRFAVFDIDGTLIRWQLYHAVADEMAKSGLIDVETYAGVREARMQWKERTHADAFKNYENHLIGIYSALLPKLPVAEFSKVADKVFDEYKDQVYAYTRQLIASLKKKGYLLFAISGSQSELVEKIASYYGFDDFAGSIYERKGGYFTGVVQKTLGTKDVILRSLVKKHQATFIDSVAVGDSESDITMLEAVEQPIAFNPTKKLFEHAKTKGWKVVIERKNVVYELKAKDDKYILAQANT